MGQFTLVTGLGLAGVIISVIALFVTKTKAMRWIAGTAGVISAFLALFSLSLPAPEIYTTNGASIENNQIYMETEWLYSIWYTIEPNQDPKLGQKYKEPFDVTESVTINAKTTLFGLFWSEPTNVDIVIGTDGSLSKIENGEPGSSICELSVVVMSSELFPGNILEKDDLLVEGKTIYGETVSIQDYYFETIVLCEGVNDIVVTYRNLLARQTLNIAPPSLVGLRVEYIGGEIHEDDLFDQSMFIVEGIYEDGSVSQQSAFDISPSEAGERGAQMVMISVGDISAEITVTVYEKEYGITLVNELHTPNGSYDPKVYVDLWEENVDYTIDGKTYVKGSKITFDNWMSGLMGNGNDFAETVKSTLYYSVNQDVVKKWDEDEKYFSGQFVVSRDTAGSVTTLEIAILVDGVEVYTSGSITSSSTNIPAFSVPIGGVETIEIVTTARVSGNEFVLGIIYD